MAKGWDGIEQQTAATAEARERAGQSFLPDLRINAKNPGPFIIRFCEQGNEGPYAVNNFAVHSYNVPDGKGGWWARFFTCLTELKVPASQCPGCVAGLKRKNRGVYNVIQRQRPVLRRDPTTKKALKTATGEFITDGYADQIVIANVGGPTAEMLRKLDGSMGGLMSRDWQVVYSGDNFQSWSVSPVVDAAGNAMATPMSPADVELLAQKHDLDAYMKPPPIQEAQDIVNKYGANSGVQNNQQPQAPAVQQNQFLAGADLTGAPFNPLAAVTGQPQQQ